MKKFVVNENLTVFADLTQVNGINVLENTVDVIVNGDNHCRIVYDGENHEDACKFAEKLAAEVDAAKSGKAIPAKDFSVTEKTTEIKVTDDDEKPITDIYGNTIEPIQISALYINEFGDVRAVIAGNNDITALLKQFETTETTGAYIDALAKRCELYTVDKFKLYVDPVSVKKVFIDNYDAPYNVCVAVGDFDLSAGTFYAFDDAMAKLKELKKAFNL